MRGRMEDAEFRLWCALKGRGLDGLRFRRQQPIGPFIVDFFCPEKKLVIEVDGEQHATGNRPARDKSRSEWLQAQGYTVIRFWTNEVMQQFESVCAAISAAARGEWTNPPHWDG